MSFLHRAFGALLLCAGLSLPHVSLAQALDPCPRLMDADDADPGTIRMIWNWFSADVADETTAYSDHDFYFTIEPGRFVNVRCDDQQFEEQEMYPLGLMVRPLAYVDLPVFEEARGDRAILVVTEYGQRKLIAESDIAPIVDNATYIFADTPVRAGICRRAEDCPGNSLDVCTLRVQCRYVVSARYGYAITATGDPATQATLDAYALLRAPQDQPDFLLSDADIARRQAAKDVVCTPFPVKAYGHGGTLHQPRDSYFSLCAQRRSEGAAFSGILPVKLVTRETARRAFSWHLDGSFHRRFNVPSSGQATTLAGALTDYRITSVKECGTELTDMADAGVTGGLKASLNAGFLEVSAGADATMTTEITRTLSADDYLLMSTYFIAPVPDGSVASGDDEGDLWFFRVMFRSKCEDGTPSSATSIIIHYHRLDGRVLEVRASDDLRRSYVDAWAGYAYAADNSAQALREGHFWIVKDLAGYFIWRDTLRSFIEVENPVTSRLLARHPEEQRAHVRDFFVYLMLAAAFNHRDPSLGG